MASLTSAGYHPWHGGALEPSTRGTIMSVQRDPHHASVSGAMPPSFERSLLGNASPADLAQYGPEAIALFAADAWDHLAAPHAAGRESIRLIDRDVMVQGRLRDLTVLQVVNDNMPFLLDSTLSELTERGMDIRFVVHPILAVERAPDGTLQRFAGEAAASGQAGTRRESLIQIHLDRIADPALRENLIQSLEQVYADVRVAVRDWGAMRGRVAGLGYHYRSNPPPLPAEEIAEAIAFLDWLADDNFTLLGVREYRYAPDTSSQDPVEGTGLGILCDPHVKVLRRGRELVTTTPEIRSFLAEPVPLIVTKASVKSRVHRRVHLDYVGVKQYSPDGILEGELRIVGLFTASAYTETTAAIPFIRHKVAQVLRRAGHDPASHSGRALLNVLENYPRDELFQIDVDTLLAFATEIMRLYERPRPLALPRPDRFDRFVSVLVYVPKDRYDSTVRQKIGEALAKLFEGRYSAAYPAYPEGPLARTHFVIGRYEGETPKVDHAAATAAVEAVVRTWSDALRDSLALTCDPARTRELAQRYGAAFSAAYREAVDPTDAVADIAVLERLGSERRFAVRLGRGGSDGNGRIALMMFSHGDSLPLSDRVPMLENLGFKVVSERTYRVSPVGDATPAALHDMVLERARGPGLAIDEPARERLEAALMAVLRGEAESDGFNALVLEAGLGWRDVAAIRALARYLQQARAPFSQDYMAATLARHAALAARIVDLLHARFDPAGDDGTRADRQGALRADIEAGLAAIASLDEDRILRRFVNLIEAAVRTSFFQLDATGRPRGTIAFKLESAKVEDLPLPRPLYEITVYSPRVEGVHLRFGKVARGGLRWSDRRQDFRTEILGLVKAQQVKNAVIVPVGAKGGFVPKRLPPTTDRQAWMAEGIAAYQEFVGTLLDLTDNLEGERIVPPAATVRHDGDDPYLVVAADKGTATFSDIANALSLDHGHWLGDAFASGGSQGYDHKKMGITARGAWEAVKRHFRELGTDIQRQDFTVVGVGDMSGDVFGNGMLLSPHIRLVAAFDHRDIFIDPEPDPTVSLAERRRLFDLPRSSWQDYDKALLSPGGGVYPRNAKSVPLSAQARAMLGIEEHEPTPFAVMRAILRAKVDLLWFGGIGTYVRAGQETDEQAGDRANDPIRITGGEIRARVIGEGANLGCTQLGRIEAARAGVRLNTDAIDNSAGVNTSDVEVNIKIALSAPERDGRLDPEARSTLLAEMTDEVATLVLRNNTMQTLALSLAEQRGRDDVGFLPSPDAGAGRRGAAGPRRRAPARRHDARRARAARRGADAPGTGGAPGLRQALAARRHLQSRLPDDPYLAAELERYFPTTLFQRFPDAVSGHRLRREIIATQLANAVINRGGPTAVVRLADQTGADAATIAMGYVAVRDSYGLLALNRAIDKLDNVVSGQVQLRLYTAVQDLLLSRLVWFLRHVDLPRDGLEATVGRFGPGIAAVGEGLQSSLSPQQREQAGRRAASLMAEGVPEALAVRITLLPALLAAPDVVLVAERSGRTMADAAATHFAVAARFRLADILAASVTCRCRTTTTGWRWTGRSRRSRGAHRALTAEVLKECQRPARTPSTRGAAAAAPRWSGSWVAWRRSPRPASPSQAHRRGEPARRSRPALTAGGGGVSLRPSGHPPGVAGPRRERSSRSPR